MNDQLLSPQKLFRLQRRTLEKRIRTYYQQTRDEKATIKYLLALQVRDQLTNDDFSFVLTELVHKIFLQRTTSRDLRRYSIYFQNYFEQKDWSLVVHRLFPIKTFIAEKHTQLYTHFVDEPLKGLASS
ncbi:hypothetical protein [Enterococcus sp.]|uniref:hypothetical protein n=1 Tax=Enterococcus sp. TaxID=35783 RepID=UPI0029103858|nr:hypothetical protein [Enterococcus sp.]MDU5334414.1 hypothetical protein [Enterococcus sp.]